MPRVQAAERKGADGEAAEEPHAEGAAGAEDDDDAPAVSVYETHDNGGRPFTVEVTAGNAVRVRLNDGPQKGRVVYRCQAERVLVGHHYRPEKPNGDNEWGVGNSVLVALTPTRYCFVGEKVYEFDAPEPIKAYYSYVGNSDVPYPVAVSGDGPNQGRAHFMLDKAAHVARSRLKPETPLYDAYRDFYDPPINCRGTAVEGFQMIHERL